LTDLLRVSSLAPIARLLLWRRPATIARFIVAIIVDAVNRVLRSRRKSHVSKKCFKGLSPTTTDANTSAPIIRVRRSRLGMATAFHRTPYVVNRRVRHTVRGHPFSCYLSSDTVSVAAATFVSPPLERIGANCFYVSTITAALPVVFVPLASGVFKHEQSIKTSPCQVFESILTVVACAFAVVAAAGQRSATCQVRRLDVGLSPTEASAEPPATRAAALSAGAALKTGKSLPSFTIFVTASRRADHQRPADERDRRGQQRR